MYKQAEHRVPRSIGNDEGFSTQRLDLLSKPTCWMWLESAVCLLQECCYLQASPVLHLSGRLEGEEAGGAGGQETTQSKTWQAKPNKRLSY